MSKTYSERNGADVDLIFGSDRIEKLSDAQPGDVLLSRTGSFLTITSEGRTFLGHHIADYVTREGRHGTINHRADLPVMLYRPRACQNHVMAPITDGIGTFGSRCRECGATELLPNEQL